MGERDQKVEDVEALVVCKPFGKGRTGEMVGCSEYRAVGEVDESWGRWSVW